jgi:hypothetical protein
MVRPAQLAAAAIIPLCVLLFDRGQRFYCGAIWNRRYPQGVWLLSGAICFNIEECWFSSNKLFVQ